MAHRILIFDDHLIVRQALRKLLEQDGMEVVGEAWNGMEAHLMARELRADVVVLGFTRPLASWLSMVTKILRAVPKAGMILVAFEDYLVIRAFQAGIKGYVLKTRVVEELSPAIRAVGLGKTYISPGIPSAIVKACLTPSTEFGQIKDCPSEAAVRCGRPGKTHE